jgi:pimeloyl-ACP methyl ester carboxylesterase
LARFNSNGVQLHYVDRGSGAAVALLHGFTSSFAGTWERTGWADRLVRNGRRVVGLDFPSHGESRPGYQPDRCSPTALASDVVALLDDLGLERVDLVGFSLGAGVALRIAMDRPQRVRRLVVGGIGDAAINERHDPEQIAAIAAAFQATTSDDVSDPVARRIHHNTELGGRDPRALLPFLQGGGWPGGLDRLGAILAPTLLFTAGRDQYMATTSAIERWLTTAEVVRRDDHDHHSILGDEELQRHAVRWLAADR